MTRHEICKGKIVTFSQVSPVTLDWNETADVLDHFVSCRNSK